MRGAGDQLERPARARRADPGGKQPLVGPGAVRRLIAAHAAGARAAVAAYDGEHRNPVLLAREHWAEATARAVGDTGALPFLRAHPHLVTAVECGDTGRPDDLDTRADLDRLAGLLRPREGAFGQADQD